MFRVEGNQEIWNQWLDNTESVFEVIKEVLRLMIMIVSHLYEYTKAHELYSLGQLYGINHMSIKLFKPNKNDTEDVNIINHLDLIDIKKNYTIFTQRFLHTTCRCLTSAMC